MGEPVPFYFSPSRVTNRTEKNMLMPDGRIRQFDAVLNSSTKVAELNLIMASPDYVGSADGGGVWQRTSSGEIMKVSVIVKLISLAANKFSILDPNGMGIEMEAGKPGWNDAMNGLPALFGSEMPSAYELHQIVDYAGDVIDKVGRSIQLPEEVCSLLDAIDTQLKLLSDGASDDFTYWDKVHDALEEYRAATDATFTGTTTTKSAESLGKASGVLGRMLARLDEGIQRALTFSPEGGVTPTYFRYTVKDYKIVGSSGRGLPTVKVLSYQRPEALPLFLEGPTRSLKTLKTAGHDAKL